MSKKKSTQHKVQQRHQPAAVPARKSNSRTLWIVAAVVVLVLGVIWAASGNKGGGAQKANAAPPEEQKYIGRLLPAGYEEPKIAGIQAYATTIKMTNVQAAQTDAGVSIASDQLVADKIVYFEYKKSSGETIPMVAYIKPSGKLFVGVSFCPPCQGKGQRIEAGGILVCETCGTARNMETSVGLSGACRLYPLDELPATFAGGKITVDKAALEQWTPQPLDRKVGA